MSLSVKVEERAPGYYTVYLDGKLDTETYSICENIIGPLLEEPVDGLLLDMSKLSYISSMGIRVIFKVRKVIETAGGSVMMANLQPQIAKVIEIANALPKTRVFASIDEADRYFDAIQRRETEGR
jgi:anti-sigma B factor antagonist